MEFDMILTRVQSALMSCHKRFGKPLTDITREHTSEVEEVQKRFDDIFRDKDIKLEEDDYRRVHFFCVLNTEFTSMEGFDDQKNRDFCYVIGLVPKLSTYLYFSLASHFKWHKFVGELISHCPEVLSLDIIKCFDMFFNIINVETLPEFYCSVLKNIFIRVATFTQEDITNKKQMFTKVFNQILQLPLIQTLQSAPKKEQAQQSLGVAATEMLNLVDKCIRDPTSNKMPLYDIHIKYDYSLWKCVDTEFHWSKKCLAWLVSKCKEVCMGITVDDYLYWCEIDVDPNFERTLQLVFRESAYICREALKELDQGDFPDAIPLVHILDNFAKKPSTEEELVPRAPISVILTSIDDPSKRQELWLQGLIKNEEVAEHIEFLRSRKSLMNVETIQLLFSVALETVDLRPLAFECLADLSLNNQVTILDWFIKENGPCEKLKTETFQTDLNTALNQLNIESESESSNFSDIIALAFQSSSALVRKVLLESISSQFKVELILSILKHIPPLCQVPSTENTVVESCIAELVEHADNYSPNEKENLILLVTKLGCEHIINPNDLVLNNVMSLFESSLKRRHWDSILFWLDFLSELFMKCGFSDPSSPNPVVVLAFLVQLLDTCRLSPVQFTALSGETCDKAVTLITNIVSYLTATRTTEDSEILWLRGLAAKTTSPMSWYLLKPIWKKWNRTVPPDHKGALKWRKYRFGHGDLTILTFEERAQLVVSLCKLLPLLTTQEWPNIGLGSSKCRSDEDLSQRLEIFNMLSDAMLVLCQLENMTGKCLPSLSYIILNFFHYIKFCASDDLRCNSAPRDRFSVIKRSALVVVHLPVEVVQVRSIQILSAFQELLGQVDKDVETRSEIKEALSTITETSVALGLSNLLKNLSAV